MPDAVAPAGILKTTASAPQIAFWNSPAKFRCLCGGIGAGKTFSGAIEAIKQEPGTLGIVVAPTLQMLLDGAVATILDKFGKFVRVHNKSLKIIQLINGMTIHYRSGDDPKHLRGSNANWVWLDEGAYLTEEVWKTMLGRLRRGPNPRLWVTTTPAGYNWVYDKFNGCDDPTFKDKYYLVYAPTRTNRNLPDDYVADLASDYSSAYAEQELEGRFVDLSNVRIRREWFRYGLPLKTLPIQLGVDLAISTKQTADYTAIVASAYDPDDGMRYVLDVRRDRKTFHGAQQFIIQMAEKWNPTVINVESVAYQAAAVQELLRTTSLNVKGINNHKDKATRFAPVEARMEQGMVTFAPGLPAYFEDELLSWPTGKHDDCIDGAQLSMNISTRRAVRVLS